MGNLRTAVVILNWNSKHLLERFLSGVIKHTPDHVELIIADNGSTDDSITFLETNFPNIRVIQNGENLGFAGGYNKALKEVNADIYILLNSDIEVTENWTEPCLELFEKNKNLGALQPKLRALDNREYFEYAGAAGGFIDILGFPFCRGRLFNTLEKDTGQYDNPTDIFWATGAALFVRADLFHAIGGFDRRFFAHMEEIDLCWRILNRGYKVMYTPDSTVYHMGGGSLPKSNPRKTKYNFRNNLWMLAKLMPARWFYTLLFPRLIMDFLAALSFLFSGKTEDCMAVFKAHLEFFRKLPELRKEYPGSEKKIPALVYRRSIVWDYFIMKKRSYLQIDKKASKANQ